MYIKYLKAIFCRFTLKCEYCGFEQTITFLDLMCRDIQEKYPLGKNHKRGYSNKVY